MATDSPAKSRATPPDSPTNRPRAPSRSTEGAICIVLAAGFTQVERDFDNEKNELAGIPKALLPVAGKPMLDHWWEYISQNRAISEMFIVSNALKYKHFERWATARGIAVGRVVNSGASLANRGRGVLRDVELALRRARQTLGNIDERDVIIFAGDTLFFKDFDLNRILDFHNLKGGSLALFYRKRDGERPSERGMCDVDSHTGQVLAFAEKPAEGQRGHDFPFVSPLFYILEPEAWQQIAVFNAQIQTSETGSPRASAFSFGNFVEHAVGSLHLPFWGMRMPGGFFLIGARAGIEEYQQLNNCFSRAPTNGNGEGPHIHCKTYARVGLVGNPSDGFNGKTISLTISNFWASVELWESEKLTLLPHPLYDPSSFSGLADLHFIGRREGYYGGTRLLMATCKRFQELCTNSGIALPRKNFTAKYDTNVPRQVGLAGSSAIVNSVFQALMKFYDLTPEHVPLERQPSFVLSVESELGIQAGLQDRVVQVYQGLVYMDFSEEHMTEFGYGKYERFSQDTFEWFKTLPFFISYEADPSDSGKIHSNVRARWDAKDPEVIEAMKHFAALTDRARDVIERRDWSGLADIMDENFATRRKLYGDACLGKNNLQMVEICQQCGAAAKFPGSGGAVLGLCRPPSAEAPPGADDPITRVRDALEGANYVFCLLDPVMPGTP